MENPDVITNYSFPRSGTHIQQNVSSTGFENELDSSPSQCPSSKQSALPLFSHGNFTLASNVVVGTDPFAESFGDTSYSPHSLLAVGERLDRAGSPDACSHHLPYHFEIQQESPHYRLGPLSRLPAVSDFSHSRYSYGISDPLLHSPDVVEAVICPEDLLGFPTMNRVLGSSSSTSNAQARFNLPQLAIPPGLSPSITSGFQSNPSSAGFNSVPHRLGFFRDENQDDLPNLHTGSCGPSVGALGSHQAHQGFHLEPHDSIHTCPICEQQIFGSDEVLRCLRCETEYHHKCITYGIERIGRSWQCDECDSNITIPEIEEQNETSGRKSSVAAPGANFRASTARTLKNASNGSTKQSRNANVSPPKTPAAKRRNKSTSPQKRKTKDLGNNRIQKPLATSGRPTAWTKEEGDICIAAMKMIKATGNYTRIDDMWGQASLALKEHNVDRSAAAVKNAWNRELRARSGFDERATPNPNNMRTGLLQPKRVTKDGGNGSRGKHSTSNDRLVEISGSDEGIITPDDEPLASVTKLDADEII